LLGERGGVGPAGEQGDVGDPGPRGELGGPGKPGGPRGFAGDPGPVGKTGLAGAKGRIGPRGPEGPTGPRGIQGKPGVFAGIEYVVELDVEDDRRRATNTVEAICTVPKSVIGGGFHLDKAGVEVLQSFPIASRKGWRVTVVQQRGNPDYRLTVYAICVEVQ